MARRSRGRNALVLASNISCPFCVIRRSTMNTPQGKYQLPRTNSASKYLTPCRTFGLKRKSSSPRTPGPNLKVMSMTEQCDSPLSSGEKSLKRPLQNIENKNAELIISKNILEECTVKKQNISNDKHDTPITRENVDTLKSRKPNGEEKNEPDDVISEDKLLEIIRSINSKVEKINILKRNEVYTRKHDINKLKKSTENWKKTCQEVVAEIHEVTKSRGHDVSLRDILDQHNIPYNIVDFNEEIMDFD